MSTKSCTHRRVIAFQIDFGKRCLCRGMDLYFRHDVPNVSPATNNRYVECRIGDIAAITGNSMQNPLAFTTGAEIMTSGRVNLF